ncbi:SRPBCC family protein [Sporolactobacillus pectinivorans]|uniref:SRPBCC family protein n=1 Tax=Sporolactobacillus pectinivorans TaxID=1591408 RepID=UPI000C26311B|nr:SRPBCC family protein [Sporolactobacillus pectinivorans]
MAFAEFAVSIHRPVKEIYDFILNGENNKLWRPSVVDVKQETAGAIDIGTKFSQTMKGPFGKSISGDYEITECKADQTISFKVISGPARPVGHYVFENDGEETKVTFTLSFKPSGFARLMDPMINKQMQLETVTISNVKKYLEEKS